MSRGKKNNLATKRDHKQSLADVRLMRKTAFNKRLAKERQALEEQYRVNRIEDPIAKVPDHTDLHIVEALNEYIDTEAKESEMIILQEFLAGQYSFENFGSEEFERAYVIYDALELIDAKRIDADFEAILNDVEDYAPRHKDLLPTTIDYRHFDLGDTKGLASKRDRKWMKEYAELVQDGKAKSGRACDLRNRLESVGHTHSNCCLFMGVDAKLAAEEVFSDWDD
jgi:hypothetical protein